MSNPLSLVYDRVVQMLSQNATFAAAVAPGNLVDRSSARPSAVALTAGRAPIVDVVPIAVRSSIDAASNATKIEARFAIVAKINGASWSHLCAVVWGIVVALHDWEVQLKTLTWNGQPFVISCRQLDAAEVKLNVAPSVSYQVLWAGEVWMWFSKNNLMPPNP